MTRHAPTACTSNATYGVRHRGCSAPNADGRNRSIPATNGSRAVAANHPPQPPTALTVTSTASAGTSQAAPTFPAIV